MYNTNSTTNNERPKKNLYDRTFFRPEFATMVLLFYTASLWLILFVFEFFTPAFLSAGPGRAETLLDTSLGKSQYNVDMTTCLLLSIQAGDTSPCLTSLPIWQALQIAQPDTPLLQFAGVVIDTWPEWFALAFFAFANYFMNYYGLNTVQNWNITVIQDPSKTEIPQSKFDVFFSRYTWIIFEFSIYLLDIYLALTQIDMLAFSVLGYAVASTILANAYMESKTQVPAELLFSDTTNDQPAVFMPMTAARFVDGISINAFNNQQEFFSKNEQIVGTGNCPINLQKRYSVVPDNPNANFLN